MRPLLLVVQCHVQYWWSHVPASYSTACDAYLGFGARRTIIGQKFKLCCYFDFFSDSKKSSFEQSHARGCESGSAIIARKRVRPLCAAVQCNSHRTHRAVAAVTVSAQTQFKSLFQSASPKIIVLQAFLENVAGEFCCLVSSCHKHCRRQFLSCKILFQACRTFEVTLAKRYETKSSN